MWFRVKTRHRASTSMYSLTFCIRVISPERHHWKPAVQAATVMLRMPAVDAQSPASQPRPLAKVFMTHVQVFFRKSLSKATFERKLSSVSLALLEQKMMGWQWHQENHMQIICTLLQTDNHTSSSSFRFYKGTNGCRKTSFEPLSIKIARKRTCSLDEKRREDGYVNKRKIHIEMCFSCMHRAVVPESFQSKFCTSTPW